MRRILAREMHILGWTVAMMGVCAKLAQQTIGIGAKE